MRKKRVLELATYAGSGGTQQEILKLVRRLSRAKYDVTVGVLLPHGILNDAVAALGIEQTSFNMRGYWDVFAWWKLYRFAAPRRFDLMRTYGLKGHIIGRIVGKGLLRIPVVITSIHSTDPWRRRVHTTLEQMTAPLTDLYISNSEAGRLATHRRERIPLSKILTIPNGVDLAEYPDNAAHVRAMAAAQRAQLGLALDAPVIGIVANLREMKGHRTIIDALPAMLQAEPRLRGLFVGEDLLGGAIQRYAHEKRMDAAIVFTGLRRDIPAMLAAFDIFLLPSLWEGLPTSIGEAMAMRKPVIASNVGGIPEIVADGVTGIVIPPNDPAALAQAVIALLKQPQLAQQMGESGYARIREHFALDVIVPRVEAVYDELLSKSKALSLRA